MTCSAPTRLGPAFALLAGLLIGCAPSAGGGPSRPAPSAGDAAVVSGTVVDAEGAPVGGASVTAFRLLREYRGIAPSVERIGRTASAADGTFRLAVDRSADVLLVGAKGGLAVDGALLDADKAVPRAVLKLPTASVLAGRVVDEKGRPVAEATVVLSVGRFGRRRRRYHLRGHERIGALTRVTGADGRFRFANVPAGLSGHFRVAAPGRAVLETVHRRRGRGFDPPVEDIRLTLAPGGAIEAVVLDGRTGRPVPGVALVADVDGAGDRLGRCVSRPEARFRFEGLPAGRCRLALALPAEGQPSWAAAQVTVEVKPAATRTGVKVEVGPGGFGEVAVADAEDGNPVRGAHVAIRETGTGWHIGEDTNADGLARLRLAPGTYRVEWVWAHEHYSSRSPGSLKIDEGETSRLEVRLKPVPRFSGTVVDAAGRPAAGARLCILPADRWVRADKQGRFATTKDLRRWQYRRSFTLLARCERRGLAAAVEVRESSPRVKVVLAEAAALRGRVVAADGRPVSGAEVRVLMGRQEPDALPELGDVRTGPDGRYAVAALPPGQRYVVRVEADGCGAAEAAVGPAGEGRRLDAPKIVVRRVRRGAPAPTVTRIDVPDFKHAGAVWGASGRDRRGHVWFGVSAGKAPSASAHLFELTPATGKVVDRGSVLDALKAAGLDRPHQAQMKIHSKIIHAADGHLYFASMDEHGEDPRTGRPPTWGSHLWRLRLSDHRWEHLGAAPEGLIAAAAGSGRRIYALGYWDHKLYAYDIRTGRMRSVSVGSLNGHISRNFVVDAADHVYVPRVAAEGPGGRPVATLVEYDPDLKEVARTPLRHYLGGSGLVGSHGITAWQPLPDGSVAFLTHRGFLRLIRPRADSPAKIVDLGWFDPDGPGYAASLFADDEGGRLMGVIGGGRDRSCRWVVYDLKARTWSVAAMKIDRPKPRPLHGSLLYGCRTRDDRGNCYVVGARSRGPGGGFRPIVLQVRPAPRDGSRAGGGD